jgi:hypothetical protein
VGGGQGLLPPGGHPALLPQGRHARARDRRARWRAAGAERRCCSMSGRGDPPSSLSCRARGGGAAAASGPC